METKEIYCFNSKCKDYPTGIDIFKTEEADLTFLNQQLNEIERNLGQIVKTCDYYVLAWFLLERRRRIVEGFFSSGIMRIDDFLLSNEILLFIKKYKSFGIRKDLTFKAIIQLYRHYSEQLKLIEDLKEGRYLLARSPKNKIYRLKYFDIIIGEIWSGYGLVNLQSPIDVNKFRYHEVIEKIVKTPGPLISTDYAPYFERLWPFAVSAQYLIKRNYSTALKYQYSVTPADLANILSFILSLKDNKLTAIPLMNLLKHFIKQPIRDKNIKEFIDMLSGDNDKIPIVFKTDGNIILDKPTLLLFFVFMFSQHLPSIIDISGPQRMALLKKEAGSDFEKYLRNKLEEINYYCLPPSTNIGGREYDILSFSESNKDLLIIETKFKDPSPSSFSVNTLIEQEFTYEKYGLLPQVIRQQERYDLLFEKPELFQKTIGLKHKIIEYTVNAYFITKYTPLIKNYGDVRVMSDREFIEKVLHKKSTN
ncbi:MAG: hypothetical protein ABR958_05475 [Dehalococcoidales bacterium]